MDILLDKPVYGRSSHNEKDTTLPAEAESELPSYLGWLESGKDGRPLLQAVLVRVLATQLKSKRASRWSYQRIMPWLSLPLHVVQLALGAAGKTIRSNFTGWSTQIKESRIFADPAMRLPRHGE
jgi:hypothetical protein